MPPPRIFHDEAQFLDALRRLLDEGVAAERIRVITPFPVPEVETILPAKRSKVRFFSLFGASAGMITGFAFTILTMLSWPLIVGGKPIVSIPPFIIIAFELTILFGAVCTFLGFLLLARKPGIRAIRSGTEYGNAFVILLDGRGPR